MISTLFLVLGIKICFHRKFKYARKRGGGVKVIYNYKILQKVVILALFLAGLTLLTSPVASASYTYEDNVIYVDNDWSADNYPSSELTWNENAFASIQNAIDNADSVENNKIVVFPGIYDNRVENFPIYVWRENLTIVSENGPYQTILKTDNIQGQVLGVENGVTLGGFTVAGAENNMGIGIWHVRSVTLENNRVENNGHGIVLDNSMNNVLDNNTVYSNKWGDQAPVFGKQQTVQ